MRAVKTSQSLVVRLVAFAVLILLASGVARYLVVTSTLRDSVEQLAASQQLALANYVAADIDGKVLLRRRQLEALARALAYQVDQPRGVLEHWLAERSELLAPFTLGLALIPLDGHGTLADLPVGSGRDQVDYHARDWFVEVLRSGDFALGRAGVSLVSHQPSIVMAVPVKDHQGRLRAVLAGMTALESPGFLDLIQHNSVGRPGGLLLVSPRDRQFVASSDPAKRLQPTPAAGVNPLHDRAMAGYRGTGVTRNAAGVEELSAMAGVPSANWFVVARLPTSDAFAPVRQVTRFNLVGSLGIGSLVVVSLLMFLRSAMQPLRSAAKGMRRMADGEIPLAQLPVVRHDEVGQMVEGFNHLVGKLQASEDRLAALAHQDALTGLPNRRAFFKIANRMLDEARRDGRELALLFLDIDGFKAVNDRLGHQCGDDLLRQFAARLREMVRGEDLVARFGGDEFIVLLAGPLESDALQKRIAALVSRLSEAYPLGSAEGRVGASVGVARFPGDAADLDRLVALADAGMYQAKRDTRRQTGVSRSVWRPQPCGAAAVNPVLLPRKSHP